MKKLSLIVMSVGISLASFANDPIKKENERISLQSSDGGKCFDESTHIINVGIGVGSGYYYKRVGGKYSSSPAISLSYEQPWPQRLGPGYLGVGAYLGFQTSHYRYDYKHPSWWNNNNYYYEERWNHYIVTGRAAYHWDVLNSEKAEVYAGVIIGARFRTYSYTDNDPDYDYYNNGSAVSPAYSVFAGARYYFGKNIGVYAEVGYGISYGTVGLSIKF
jgi:hypothetical protein